MNKTSKTEDFSDLTIGQIIGMLSENEADLVNKLKEIKKGKQHDFLKEYNTEFGITTRSSLYPNDENPDNVNLTEKSIKHVSDFIDSINYMLKNNHYSEHPISLLSLLDIIETPSGTKSETYLYLDIFLRSFGSPHSTLGPARAKVITKTEYVLSDGRRGCYLQDQDSAEKYVSYLERLI